MSVNPAVFRTFLEESEERLDDMESGILAMCEMPDRLDPELIHSIFRDAHSVKAGANLLGYKNIEVLSHKLENILDMVRMGRMTPTALVTDTLLQTLDRIHDLVDDVDASNAADISDVLNALSRIAPSK